MWQLDTGISFSTSKYECGFIDSVNDVSWNEVYNMNALSGFGQEYPLLVYVFERKEPLIIEDEEIIGKEKMINNQYAGSGIFKPMIEDTKALKEEENMFNTKFNINNNYMNNNINPFLNSHINNNHINNNMGNDDELNNILPDDYMKKADKIN